MLHEARDRLARALAASVMDEGKHRITKFRHYCPVGCHASPEAAVDDISNDINLANLDMAVPVPALNRWLKLFSPLAFWCAGTIGGYLPSAFEEAFRPICQENAHHAVAMLSENELIGLGEEDTYMKKREKRFRRASGWLSAESTALQQSVGCVLLVPIVRCMGSFFKAAEFERKKVLAIYDFCRETSSPGSTTINRKLEREIERPNEFRVDVCCKAVLWVTRREDAIRSDRLRWIPNVCPPTRGVSFAGGGQKCSPAPAIGVSLAGGSNIVATPASHTKTKADRRRERDI